MVIIRAWLRAGRLAAACPGRVVTLVASDVPGDDPAVIGSGPTVPDPTTYADALAIVEAVARLCEGVLGNPESAARDSFGAAELAETGTWLECPQYTRPPVFRGD